MFALFVVFLLEVFGLLSGVVGEEVGEAEEGDVLNVEDTEVVGKVLELFFEGFEGMDGFEVRGVF